MDVSARTFNEDGKSWAAERIGRTSGIVGPKDADHAIPGPADIVRFVCKSDPKEADRETIMPAGILRQASDAELVKVLQAARRIPKPRY
jgi:hypothetical protein